MASVNKRFFLICSFHMFLFPTHTPIVRLGSWYARTQTYKKIKICLIWNFPYSMICGLKRGRERKMQFSLQLSFPSTKYCPCDMVLTNLLYNCIYSYLKLVSSAFLWLNLYYLIHSYAHQFSFSRVWISIFEIDIDIIEIDFSDFFEYRINIAIYK